LRSLQTVFIEKPNSDEFGFFCSWHLAMRLLTLPSKRQFGDGPFVLE